MVAFTSEEWAIFAFLLLLFLGILYARANRKKKTQKLRNKITQRLYNSAMEAQAMAIEGTKKHRTIHSGANIHERTMPMDLQDPTRLYVRSTLLDLRNQSSHNAQRDFLLENEYLNIDEPSRAY